MVLATFAIALAAILAGCGSGGGGSGLKVKGQVLLDSKPLTDAQLTFEGPGGKLATTDAEGKFELDGRTPATSLKPGKYVVLVNKWVDKKGNPIDKEDLEQHKSAGTAKNLVPQKYWDIEFAPLTAEIKEGVNELKPFELKSK